VTGQTITVRVHLPHDLEAVGRFLEVVGEIWPDATIDTSDPEGWRIDIGAE